MIKISNPVVMGFEPAIRGMRNPLNSWENSDSVFYDGDEYHDICKNSGPCNELEFGEDIGFADLNLMKKLANGGPVHAKYRRMIVVYVDILAPLYWWKEFDTYKVGTVANSCSTMHKIADKEFTLDDFSHDHLITPDSILTHKELFSEDDLDLSCIDVSGHRCFFTPEGFLKMTCKVLNHYRKLYLETKDKKYWWQMIQLLPSSYNQKRTIMLNYEVLSNIYASRKNHKLDEWLQFCAWIESLPHAESVIFGGATTYE